jgi:hypothetical protein
MSIDYILKSLMNAEKLKYIIFDNKERMCFDELRNFDYGEHNENFTEPFKKEKVVDLDSPYVISMLDFQNEFETK